MNVCLEATVTGRLLRLFGTVVVFGALASVQTPHTPPSPDAVLRQLQAGNANHVAKRYKHPHQTDERQHELVAGQSPDAIILSCADSRVAPEIVLDQGLGDLFDVRVAGNVPGDDEVASIEYAAEHLHAPLVVVLGHQKCGAIEAAMDPHEPHGHLPQLVVMLRPAVAQARKLPGDLFDNAVRVNVENVVQQLRTSQPVLAPLVARGALKIVGGVYSLETGKVTWLPDGKATKATARAGAHCLLPRT